MRKSWRRGGEFSRQAQALDDALLLLACRTHARPEWLGALPLSRFVRMLKTVTGNAHA
ncbi:hypothetical protein GCM10023116_39620 [Kistimonas scapharcae]|uniref:Transposase n=1 Tax=Kistimonas scapharcae TaxID=1036133 RepID=A0ABP8V5Z7_9GAMM